MFDARAFLRDKREGRSHRPEELRAFVDGFAGGKIPDYQVSAWLMAAFLNGLDDRETDALTAALLHSGRIFDWSAIGPTADKHSTGGVGDKVSLILAPLVAACGVRVPMVSGRGLGHTGGTLEKLEAIPGFRTRLSAEAMRGQLERVGVVMVGQGPDLAPADGRLYALRDVTSTVERDYFIVPSIVSKKIAEGAGAIAYDVKCGDGAFMKTREDAAALARRLVRTTRALGAKAEALVTDMSQPLGEAAGNALEVREAVDVLRGGGPPDVRSLTLDLAEIMMRLACGTSGARAQAEQVLDSGAAWERFLAMVTAQGGDARSLEQPAGLPSAPAVAQVPAARAGVIAGIDTFALGELVVAIGGGRRAQEDAVDPRVGVRVKRRVGERVKAGEALAELHLAAMDPGVVARAAACWRIGDETASAPELILERIS